MVILLDYEIEQHSAFAVPGDLGVQSPDRDRGRWPSVHLSLAPTNSYIAVLHRAGKKITMADVGQFEGEDYGEGYDQYGGYYAEDGQYYDANGELAYDPNQTGYEDGEAADSFYTGDGQSQYQDEEEYAAEVRLFLKIAWQYAFAFILTCVNV